MTIGDLITSALRELGIVDLTATPGAELSALGLTLTNRILDRWNAQHGALYSTVHSSLVAFTAGLNPHTIGVSADSPTWTVSTNRPVEILGVRVTGDDGETFTPLTPRSADWWHALQAPGTSADYPTDFYFDPTWPNGSLYFYPEPASASIKAQIVYRMALAQVGDATVVSLPPAYLDALVATLKERIVAIPTFATRATPDLRADAQAARGVAFGHNLPELDIVTDDGLTASRGGDFDPVLGPFASMVG